MTSSGSFRSGGGGLSVLFLEDNRHDFELISEYIRAEGLAADFTHAHDARTFETALGARRYDIILSDYAIPGYSGFAALKRVRELDASIPFILLSGTLSEEEAVESLRAGATDYIIKDRLHRLVPAIERALREAEELRERSRAAEALKASEERFALAARATNDVIWDWDISQEDIWTNDIFDVLFGYHHGSQTLTVQEKMARIHLRDQLRVSLRMQEKLRSQDTLWVEEYEFQRRDGSYADVLDRALIVRGADGKPLRLIGAMTDLSPRRDAERQIREQAALLKRARDAIVLVGMDQRIQYWNPSAERIFGWTAAEALGADVQQLLLHFQAGQSLFDRLLGHNEWRGELQVQTKAGKKIVVESRWSLMQDAESKTPTGILLINTDITEKKELEAQFLRAQRMEVIGSLSGGIAHDLNNALSPIVMAAELLGDDVMTDSGKRLLEMVQSSARRCGEMVKQILSFSRGVGQGWETLDPCKIIEEVASLTRETFSKRIQIRTHCEPRVNSLRGNVTQLHQVLMNLLVNARDAIGDAGTISIAVSNVLLHERASRMLAQRANGPYVRISVSDSGSGIPEEIQAKIFEPFFTTKPVGKGTGLGLSTVFSLVKSHDGFLELKSEVGRGTTFDLFFPAQVRAAEAPAQVLQPLVESRGERLLIVDDEVGLLAIVKNMLETLGYSVVTATGGLEALATIESATEPFDLVLTDWRMPLMSGAELIRKLQQIRPGLKVVLVTGSAVEDETGELNIAGYLRKPYTTETLVAAIRSALANHSAENQLCGTGDAG